MSIKALPACTTMLPKEIGEAAAPFVDRKEVRKMKLIRLLKEA